MLEQKDLDSLKNIMESVIDEKLSESENLVLDEMVRTRQILEKQIEQVRKNMDELNQYYRITRLENDNTALVLKMIDEMSKRIDHLEQKTA